MKMQTILFDNMGADDGNWLTGDYFNQLVVANGTFYKQMAK